MNKILKRTIRAGTTWVSNLFSEKHGQKLARLFSIVFPKVFARKLAKELSDTCTDKFLELLLGGMSLAFMLSKDYRRNIENFEADYVFETEDKSVGVTASFKNGDLDVHTQAKERATVKVIFKTPQALREYIFSGEQNIINSLLENDVRALGNLNYIFKFGYMAFDLQRRMGMID